MIYPLVATGLGLEPLPADVIGDARVLDQAVAQFDCFECRDQASLSALRQAGIEAARARVGLDDSYLLKVSLNSSAGPRTLHISTFDKHMPHFIGEHGLRRLRDLASGYERCAFWVCSPSDEPLVAPLRAALPDLQVYDLSQLLFGPPVLRAGDGLVTSRFHPHLLAARAGLNGYYFAASAFYRAKHHGVLKLGSPFQELHEPGPRTRPSPQPSMIAATDGSHRLAKQRVAQGVFRLASLPHKQRHRDRLRRAAEQLRGAPLQTLRSLARGLF